MSHKGTDACVSLPGCPCPVASHRTRPEGRSHHNPRPRWPRPQAPLCPSPQPGTQALCEASGRGPRSALLSQGNGAEQAILISADRFLPFATGHPLPRSLPFLAIYQKLLEQKGTQEPCQKPARPPVTGGAPMAAREGLAQGPVTFPSQALTESSFPPSQTLPCPAPAPAPDGAGRMLKGIPLSLKLPPEPQGVLSVETR